MAMTTKIREARETDLEALQDLVELAFVPVFESFLNIMGKPIFDALYPDWRALQRKLVVDFYHDDGAEVQIVEFDKRPVGLVVLRANQETKHGEVEFLAVHPDAQNMGIGTLLNEYALGRLKHLGMVLVEVGTGGDISHAPARRSYEKMGYTAVPLVRYFKVLD